jgi:hypothetical protein
VYLRGTKNEKTTIMQKTILIFSFLAIVACGRTQDFLTPESYGVWGRYGYDDFLFELLLVPNGDTEPSYSRSSVSEMYHQTFFLCAPSFFYEYALVVWDDKLVLNKATRPIWYELELAARTRASSKRPTSLTRTTAASLRPQYVESHQMPITKDFSEELTILFEVATRTATHLQTERLILDGREYFFNYRGCLASVCEPEGRTDRLVRMVDSICYVVDGHPDMDVLNRQMEVCHELTASFKKDYPIRYFMPDQAWPSIDNYFKRGFSISLYGNSNGINLTKQCDSAASDEEYTEFLNLYRDSLAVWSREIFLMEPTTKAPKVTLDNRQNDPVCTVEQNGNHLIANITMPERLWQHDVIMEATQLPVGRYYIDEELDLHWRDVFYRPDESEEEDTNDKVDTTDDFDGVFVDYFCDPEFPGGWDSMYTFIRQNLQWPNVPEDWTDTVLVGFIVEVDGSITNPQVKVSQHPEFNEEAIRVVKLMPKWIWDPNRCYNGEVIRAYYQIPVWFTR